MNQITQSSVILGEAMVKGKPEGDEPRGLEDTPPDTDAAGSRTPTKEGVLRYPPDGRYVANGDDSNAPFCTCSPSCPADCKGQCECEACSDAYGDFLSSE